ncbi:50S ribosomal protein L15 [Synechococcus sp. H60.3]|uniref:50S ribosomal protein L15 n=2 Tax=Synechococcus TaxID=1129 RepID=UPI0039C4ABC7
MRLEDIRPQPGSTRRRRRLGRGIAAGQGASCGKGMRGQKARKGGGPRPGFEGGQTPLYRRLPKLKHFPRYVRRPQYTLINLRALAKLPAGSEVSLESLMELGIVTTNDGPLKILGDGEVGVPLTIRAAAITPSARAKVEAAGGRVEIGGSRAASAGS